MTTDETTRQVNQRAIRALEEARHRLGEAVGEVYRGIEPLEHLARFTNAHDAAVENLRALLAQAQEVREDITRRWSAESEGE